MNENAKIDNNYKRTLLGVTDDASAELRRLLVDSATGRLLISATISTGAITSLNGLTAAVQLFAVGTTGTDFAIVSGTATHTFNLPDASATARGVITTGVQTLAGVKTFSSFPITPSSAPTTDYQVANKKYVDDSISPENLWDRATTVLSPHNVGDSVRNVADYNGLVITANTGAITTGSWTATVISPVYGGTGIANNALSTLTISGNFATTITVTNTTSVTLPVSGTLVSSVTTGNGVSATNTAGALSFTLGVITPTSVNGLTITATTGTFTLTNGKTLTVSDSATIAINSITLAGGEIITFSATNALSLLTTGATSVTLPTTGTLLANLVEDATPELAAALDAKTFLINNLGDPVAPTDAVNLQTLESAIPAGLQWYLANAASADIAGYKLLAEVNDAAQTSVTADGTADGQALDEWVTLAGTPGAITITEGDISAHFYAKVGGVASTDFLYQVKVQVYKRTGAAETQLGSDTTSLPYLTTSSSLYSVHTHVTAPLDLVAGDRIVVKLLTVRTGTAPRVNAQIVTVYMGSTTPSHTSLPVSLAILGKYLPLAGGAMTGAITGCTGFNGLTITATAGTLTIPNNASAALVTSGNFSLTLTTTNTTVATLPAGTITLAALSIANVFSVLQTITINDAITNAVTNVLDLRHTTTGTAADGIGVGIPFYLEDASGNIDNAASIDVIYSIAAHATQNAFMRFTVMGTEYMRISGTGAAGTGYVGIGTVETADSRLHIQGTDSFITTEPSANDGQLTGLKSTAAGGAVVAGFTTNSSTGEVAVGGFNASYFLNLYAGNAVKLAIATTGVVTIANLAGTGSRAVNADANGVLSAASDERMKTNFKDLTSEVDVLSLLKEEKIKAVYFNWIDKTKGERRELGFTAQMWEDFIPEITGDEGEDNHKYLDYQKIVAVLWEQNKKLLERIEKLEKS